MRTPAYEERPRHASTMTWIGNAAAEKRWRRDGPRRYRPLRFLHVSWGQLSRATHLRLSNHTRQRPQLWHASDNTRCPNYPATRQASPRERETRPYPLDIQASISPSLSLSLLFLFARLKFLRNLSFSL